MEDYMNFNELITFKKAAELLNFSKTAKELNYSQSAVTVQIKNLEEEFGIQLFDRIGKNVRLTPDGDILLHHASKIINAVENARENVGTTFPKKNLLRIGCIDSICSSQMPKVLKKMHEKEDIFPVKITTSSPSKLLEMMDRNEIDIVYILDKPIHNDNWIKAYDKEEKMMFVTFSNSPLSKKSKLSINDIIKEDFYLTETNDNYRYALDQKLAEFNLQVDPILEVSNTDVILDTICNGTGVTFLPYFAFKERLESHDISIIDLDDIQMSMRKQIFYHKDKYLTEEMKSFIKVIDEI